MSKTQLLRNQDTVYMVWASLIALFVVYPYAQIGVLLNPIVLTKASANTWLLAPYHKFCISQPTTATQGTVYCCNGRQAVHSTYPFAEHPGNPWISAASGCSEESVFLYGSLAACPAICMAYRLAHGEPMLDITVQELWDHRSQWNKKHDANDAEQLSAQQGGQ